MERRANWLLLVVNLLLAFGLVVSISISLSVRGDVNRTRHDLILSIVAEQTRCEVANHTVRPKLHLPQIDCMKTYPIP